MAHNDKNLPLALRKDLRDNEAKLNKNLERIAGITGKKWTFETNYDFVNKSIDSSYQNRLGEILYGSYLDILANRIETLSKDDMVLEAFNDKVTGNKIIFQLDEDTEGYQQVVIQDGNLVIKNKPGNFWTNIDYLGNDIEKQL